MTEQMTNKEKEKITKIVDRVLTQVFGEEATQLIYQYLENKYSVGQDEIAEKIDVFAQGLDEFLDSGARVIEQKILKDIHSSYGSIPRLESRRRERSFVGQINLVMHHS